MSARLITFVAACTLFMAVVLLLDGPGVARQASLGVATAAFLWLFVRRLPVEPQQVVIAIAIATLGEIVLSLGWGLYSYEHALIPLYVPPGHGVFYTLAAATAAQPYLRRYAAAITRAAVVGGTLLALISLAFFNDVWGVLWWIAALVLIHRSRNRLLLAACFFYTILLEWAGTALGNWRWEPIVPFLGLRSANPPAGVGLLYILLDLIVVAIAGQFAKPALYPSLDRVRLAGKEEGGRPARRAPPPGPPGEDARRLAGGTPALQPGDP